jgi:hypothetical protein
MLIGCADDDRSPFAVANQSQRPGYWKSRSPKYAVALVGLEQALGRELQAFCRELAARALPTPAEAYASIQVAEWV